MGAKAVAARRWRRPPKRYQGWRWLGRGWAAMAAAKEVATVAAAMEVVAMVVMMEGRRGGLVGGDLARGPQSSQSVPSSHCAGVSYNA